MGSLHLLNEMMVDEYVDGAYRDPNIRSHIRSCSDCQAMVRDNRLVRMLLSRSAGKPSTSHIDRQIMTAFCEDRLPDKKTLQVMEHIGQCDDCLAEFKALHDILSGEPMQVSEQQVQLALQAFGTKPDHPGNVLGRLLLRRVRKEYALAFDRLRGLPHTVAAMRGYEFPTGQTDFQDWNVALQSDKLEYAPSKSKRLSNSEMAGHSAGDAGDMPPRSPRPPASRRAKRLVDIDLPTGTLSIALKNAANASSLLLWVDMGDETRISQHIPVQACLVVTVITLASEETFTGELADPISVNVPADAICIRIESDALEEPVELDLDLTRL